MTFVCMACETEWDEKPYRWVDVCNHCKDWCEHCVKEVCECEEE